MDLVRGALGEVRQRGMSLEAHPDRQSRPCQHRRGRRLATELAWSASRQPSPRSRPVPKLGPLEIDRKSEPFDVYNDVGSPHPFAAKRPILAALNCGINDGSSFCGAQPSNRLMKWPPDAQSRHSAAPSVRVDAWCRPMGGSSGNGPGRTSSPTLWHLRTGRRFRLPLCGSTGARATMPSNPSTIITTTAASRLPLPTSSCPGPS